MERISVMHVGGDRFRIYVRKHEFEVDQPAEMGGQDLAPTPTELFVASLASCVAFYAHRFMRRHDIPDHVEVYADFDMGERPARVAHVSLLVEAPDVPAEMKDRFQKMVEHCTVHNSITQPPEMTIETRVAKPVHLAS